MEKYDVALSINDMKRIFKLASENENASPEEMDEMLNDIDIEVNMYNAQIISSLLTAGQNIFWTEFEPTWKIETFYRIGNCRQDETYNYYYNSWNFADDRREIGVSVITKEWLNSLKSVFFGTSTEKIKARGIYKIEGIVIGRGGDGEPLIIPTSWAEKTKIRILKGLKKIL